jgi:hypothetical protein
MHHDYPESPHLDVNCFTVSESILIVAEMTWQRDLPQRPQTRRLG